MSVGPPPHPSAPAARHTGSPSAGVTGGVLVVLCLVLFLPGFFVLPPFDRDEARFAQASRQMLETGDLIDIRFQNDPRHKKPAGIYWLQASSAALFGSPASPAVWPYRVPSLLGAMTAVLLVAWAGRGLFGPMAGLLAGLIMAGCVLLGVEARMAKTDAVLLATVAAAQLCLARLYLEAHAGRPSGWPTALAFWTATGASILIKGPIGPMVSALTILALAIADRHIGWLARLRPITGMALAVTIAAPWLVAITLRTDGAFLAEAIGHDMWAKVGTGMESKGLPAGYYLVTGLITFAPFAFLVPMAVPWVWHRRKWAPVRFCLAWLVPTWVVFELVATKLLHYTLPVFPALALLIAAAVLNRFDRPPGTPRRWLFGIATGIGALGTTALILVMPVLLWLTEQRIDALTTAMTAVTLALMIWAWTQAWHDRAWRTIPIAVAAFGLLYASSYRSVLPQIDTIWVSRTAAAAVSAHRPCADTVVASAGFSEPSLVFLLGTPTRLGLGPEAARHLLDDPACALALIEQRQANAFRATLGEQTPMALARFNGFNYSKGDWLDFTLYAFETE